MHRFFSGHLGDRAHPGMSAVAESAVEWAASCGCVHSLMQTRVAWLMAYGGDPLVSRADKIK